MKHSKKGFLTYKRLVCTLLILPLMMAAIAPAMAGSYTATIVNPRGNSNVNLRAWASLDAQILCTLPRGTTVQVVGQTGDFYQVFSGNTSGYVYCAYIATGNQGGFTQGGQTATVSAGPVNLRLAPSNDARVITQLTSGAIVEVLTPGNTWTQVRVGDVCGYLFTSYLSFSGTPAPAPKPPVTKPVAPKPPVAQKPVNTKNANATIRTANGGNLNLRMDASSYAGIAGSYANGTRVRVITHGTTWCKVQVGNTVGYMSTRFLAFDGHGGATIGGNTVINRGFDGIVSSNAALNLRREPSKASQSLGQYKSGTRVEILGIGTDWLRVRIDGKVGYMMTQFVKIQSAKTAHKTVLNNGSFVNLRAGMSMDSKVLKQVTHGSAATVVIPYANWSRVIVKDGNGYTSGYMMNSFLK